MRSYKIIFLFLISGLLFNTSYSQDRDEDLIQFTGVVVTGDSLNPVPYTNVLIEDTHRGTMTDFYGYFSFVAQKGDSILFSAVGFKRVRFIIPDTLTTNKYSLIQILNRDTVLLSETVIYPWPSREQFKEAFLAMEVPETDFDRAERNMAEAQMYERMLAMPGDGSENFKYQMQNYQSQLYYAGQAPPINILNPIAWGQFIQAWKRGDFKKREK